MTASQKQIDELRSLFQQKLDSGITDLPAGPHPIDLERAKDDNWLRKFINHCECDMNEALGMMVDVMVWRKQNNVNELSESKLNMEYLKEGLFYPKGKDIDNCTIFIFHGKKHTKGDRDTDELKKCIVYWFERMDKIDKCEKITMFFDMTDAGISNLDKDLTNYFISLFKLYYPDFLNYIIIFEMPWVLSAAFKIIKSLLPKAGAEKMRFLSKSDLADYVPLEQALTIWGGKDSYTFTFISEPLVGSTVSQNTEKKVTFSDPGSPMQENKQVVTNEGDTNKITLSPNDCVIFTSDGKDVNGTFTLTNSSSGLISYKIKTTSPEKFRVRPTMGILDPGASQAISLLLLEGYQISAAGLEKFLVTCVTVDKQISSKELAEMWKDMSKLKVEQHKLRCTYPKKKKTNGTMSMMVSGSHSQVGNAHSDMEADSKDIDKITHLVTSLKHNQESLDKSLKTLKTIQLLNLLLTALLLCLIIYMFGSLSGTDSTTNSSSGEFCSST